MNDGTGLQIVARLLLRGSESPELWRVVLVESPYRAWLAPLSAKTWPHARDLVDLRDELEDGTLICESVDPFMGRAVSSLSEGSKHAERDRGRWQAIESLVDGTNLSKLMRPEHRGALLGERAKAHGTSYQNLTNLLRLYWARGMSPSAVSSDFAACGAKGRTRKLTDKKPGPIRLLTDGANEGVVLPGVVRTDEVCLRFMHGAALHQGKGWNLKQAWREILRLWWSDIKLDENDRPVGDLHAAFPSYRQFQNFVVTQFTDVERKRRRIGQNKFDLTGRGLPGTADGDTDGPGSRYEIDATIADIYLVSKYDRTRIVGRPTIYFVVDVWSRLIVGLYVGFEAPSWLGAISALVNAVTPKVGYCQSFGREIEEWEWPSHHLPSKVLGDRGEMMSVRNGRNLVNNLHVQIENTPPGRGDLKSIVERRFGIVPATYKEFMPGYVRPDFGERGAEDYRKRAQFNLSEFTLIMIEAVLKHNRTAPDGRTAHPGMVADRLTASPLDFWAWGIVNRSGKLKEWDLDLVALNLLPVGQARLTARGVQFAEGVYSCGELEATDWLAAARMKTVPIEVSYDPRCMDVIYFRDDRLKDRFIRLDRRVTGVERNASLAEIQENLASSRQPALLGERRTITQDIGTELRIRRISEKAEAETKIAREGRAVTPKELRGIRDNKAREKALIRPSEALLIEPPTVRNAPVARPEENPPPPHEATAGMTEFRVETSRERLMRQRMESEEQDD